VIQSGVTSKTGNGSPDDCAALKKLAAEVEEKLTEYYGPREYNPEAYDKDLLGALIATLLSQHTSDLNSGRAFIALKRAFPGGWGDVLKADVKSVADAIRHGGLANVKAPRIQRVIQDAVDKTGSASLDVLTSIGDDHKRLEFLKSFHGVGPKTAACVLCFNMGRPVIPVDTHVHRVSRRIGLIGPKTSADKAHDELLEIAPQKKAYSFHVHLIEHGRRICHARRPKCPQCPLDGICAKIGVEQ
jgi:endonuclease-3